MNAHFNMESFQTVQTHSPSWFMQQLKFNRVKQSNGLNCYYDGSLCVLNSRRYEDALIMVKREYINRFFMVNPIDCLRVIFAANFYGRMSRGIKHG